MNTSSLLELQEDGFCVLQGRLSAARVEACRERFWPILLAYLEGQRKAPKRGGRIGTSCRCRLSRRAFSMSSSLMRWCWRLCARRWTTGWWRTNGDAMCRGLGRNINYLELPTYMLVVSFSLVPVTIENGPIEITPGTHRLARSEAVRAVEAGEIPVRPVPLEVGDVLIRHPWALHRGAPNWTDMPIYEAMVCGR